MNKTHKGTRKGFTLLEILLVIAAIGILAAIVLVAINPNRQIAQARNAQRRSDVNTIYKALEQYLIDNQSYAVGGTGINTDVKNVCKTGNKTITDTLSPTTLCDGKVDLRVLVPNYIAAIPTDPAGGEYTVRINSDNNRISVSSPDAQLNQSIAINPKPPTPEELIQAQITAGTLIPTGTQQLVLNRLVYKNNAGTQTYIDKATTTKTCPAGYIPVPGNSMYGTSDFCVMKYEAKAVQINAPTVGLTTPNTGYGSINNSSTPTTSANGRAIASVASGFPIAQIVQSTALDYCANQNTVLGASLISNAEWMTIARNIEAQASNWIGGAVGSGGIYRGHSDTGIDSVLGQQASTDDNDGYFGTGNDINNGPNQKRTHTLSNGEVIWDLSGNQWEWISDTIMGVNKPIGGPEFTSITGYGQLSYDLTRPSNTNWTSTQNMGQYLAGSLTGGPFTILRGGRWHSGYSNESSSGIFSLNFNFPEYGAISTVGFRCVTR